MANKAYSKKSSSETSTTQFNEYLNIELEVAPGKTIRMPLNCAIPTDDRNLSQDQKKLRDLFMGILDTIDKAAANGATPEELQDMAQIKVPVHASLYRRKTQEVDSSNWYPLS